MLREFLPAGVEDVNLEQPPARAADAQGLARRHASPCDVESGARQDMSMRYALVTPTRDEETDLPRLAAESLAAQTVRPDVWVIVDNGSTDRTVEIARARVVRGLGPKIPGGG